MSMSLDGIASGTTEADFWAVHEAVLGWVFNLRSWRSAQGMEGGEDNADSKLWAAEFDRVGAQIVGRRMFDFGVEPWGENPPFHAPVFVLTSRGQDRIDKEGGTSYSFVTDGIESAVAQAKAAAGGRDVLVAGGLSVAQQALRAGLVDELSLHVRPVLLGGGARLFDAIGSEHIQLESDQITGSGGVTHLRYAVVKRATGPEEVS